MCNELQKRIWVVALLSPGTVGDIARILTTPRAEVDNAIEKMDNAGMLLSEDDNGILTAFALSGHNDSERQDIDLTVWTECRTLIRAARQQMTLEEAMSDDDLTTADTVTACADREMLLNE